MNVFTGTLPYTETSSLSRLTPVEELLVFDIETTGFTPEHTILYLICCAYYQNGAWHYQQWFNEDGSEEQALLQAFLTFAKPFRSLFHYNGDRFDIPYLQHKIQSYGLSDILSQKESYDLYPILRPFKEALHLDNLKQKTIERFLIIDRVDKYSGGDLIQVYQRYIQSKDAKLLQLLLQHNFEDVEGLLQISQMLNYRCLFQGEYTIKDAAIGESQLKIHISLSLPLPKRFTLGKNSVLLTAYQQEATLTVPIIFDELKFYLKDYKNYYYLPLEDKAIHKSVASFVDRNFREKATRHNCYVKRKGQFIFECGDTLLPGFKHSLEESLSYIELTEELPTDTAFLHKYAKHIIESFL